MKIIRNREAVIVFLFKASESDLHWNVNEDDSFLWDHFPFLLAMGLEELYVSLIGLGSPGVPLLSFDKDSMALDHQLLAQSKENHHP